MIFKRLFFLVFLGLLVGPVLIFSQQQDYAPQNSGVHLLELGLVSQSQEIHPFKQFTGENVYNNAESSFYLTWLGYHYAIPVDFFFIQGISMGLEYHNYTLKPVLKSGSLKNKPRPVLDANIVSGVFRIYFFPIHPAVSDAEQSLFQFYFGVGWGYMQGKITGEYVKFSPKNFSTSLSGAYTYREFGGVLRGDTVSFGISLKFIRANQIRVEDNLFNQKQMGENNLFLNFDGISNSLHVTFSF